MDSEKVGDAPRPPEIVVAGDLPRPPEGVEEVGDGPRPPEGVMEVGDVPRPPEGLERPDITFARIWEIEEVDESSCSRPPEGVERPDITFARIWEIEEVDESSCSRPPRSPWPFVIVEEGPSSRPLQYAPAAMSQWRPPVPEASCSSSSSGAGADAGAEEPAGASGGGGAAARSQWRPPVPAASCSSSSSGAGADAGAEEPSGASGGGGAAAQHFESERLPPTLVPEIRPLLRVANQLDGESPRVAFLCRFHAFEKAHLMDPESKERGVMQFKTLLSQTLVQDEKVTSLKMTETDDAREIKSFYEKKKQDNAHDLMPVLAEVLKAVLIRSGLESPDVSCGGLPTSNLGAYNILPLTPSSKQEPIMLLPEIKAALSAVCNLSSLQLTNINDETSYTDMFLWLQSWFGFQSGNVANQREHLILLLANMHARLNPDSSSDTTLDDRAVDELLAKTFDNYLTWCKFLGRLSNIRLPEKQEVQQYKLLYVALYLLIWGEAANLRFMPECFFHYMSYELYGVLSGAESIITGEKIRPAYGGEDESFLNNVVTPIYKEIEAEAVKNKNGVYDHSKWRNYDDINEFFWSADCFKLGWPMRLNNDFFFSSKKFNSAVPQQSEQQTINETSQQRWLGKTNFVEVRSFWHLFRSFDRMWTLLVLGLQILIIMAWHGLESPLQLLGPRIFEDILSIFITNAVLRVIQVIGDIAFSWRTKAIMRSSQKLRFSIKICFAVTWSIILPIFYSTSARCTSTFLGMLCLSKYMVAVALYLTNNVIGMVVFFIPSFRSYIETSSWKICRIISWWCQPQSYVGRGMHEGQGPLLKYTSFWMVLLASKFLFSYYFEIKPLVEATKEIMNIDVNTYEWHEFFPQVKSNAGVILAVWAPRIIVYFMDTQIWYSVFCSVFGGMSGIVRHLGEIRTLEMVRRRFWTLPKAFNASLVPSSTAKEKKRMFRILSCSRTQNLSKSERDDPAKFALVWNQIMNSLRSEDLICNRELDLMTMPMSLEYSSTCWPLFLLAEKFSKSVDMAAKFTGNSAQLLLKVEKDNNMFFAINDFYNLARSIFSFLVIGDVEKRVVDLIFSEIEKSVQNSSILEDFRLDHLAMLVDKVHRVSAILLKNKEDLMCELTILLQDIIDILIQDMLVHNQIILDQINSSDTMIPVDDGGFNYYKPELFVSISSKPKICFPFPDSGPLKEQVKRLYLLLNTKEKAVDIPSNLEARRRISFFATSLFMDMPAAPQVRNMLSFSIITPYFMEEVIFSEEEFHSNQDEASILSYMQKIYPDEWRNFLERLGSKVTNEEIRYWASFRGQTLSRTVRGMMYYRKALRLQAFLDRTNDQGATEGGEDVLAEMKFSYVIACQKFWEFKSNNDRRAQDIIDLMARYPALRVAYIEEKEIIIGNRPQKVYSSVLIKAENNFDQEIYRVKLPGPPIIGEGKPENQNLAIIFTRGEALQTIDMNQDNYLEEAYKIRNVLEEFGRHPKDQSPTILGIREHIFTGSVSSLAGFMSYQETGFVTIGQRLLADPLRVRFHYGHSDIFDRMFHLTRGGISKATKATNLSEDVFAGYNSILRRGHITYNEYIQVGKGRDVGFNDISNFESKVASGNGEQTISRDIYRLGRQFDFFRMLSCYYTTVGFYFNILVSVLGVFLFLYGQLYFVMSGLQKSMLHEAEDLNMKSLETVVSSQSVLQLGLLTGLPIVIELGLEKGFREALSDFVVMQLQGASVFFTFSLGTKAHYYGRTILHGGAKYRPTGRKFAASHASFTENYQLYSRSHFIKGFELVFLLAIYHIFIRSHVYSMVYVMSTCSMWFMTVTWLFAPFVFNPAGFAWHKIVEDWTDWKKWMSHQGGIGVQAEKSWESWWIAENSHLPHSSPSSRIVEILLSLRFFLYQYELVYSIGVLEDKTLLVYLLSWVIIIAIVGFVKLFHWAGFRLSSEHQLIFRIMKLLMFLSVLTSWILLSYLCKLSIMDLIISCLAFIPTGWGLLLIVQVLRPKVEDYMIWEPMQIIAYAYDYGMGTLLFFPLAVLAWIPIIPATQTRVLFHKAFSQQPQVLPFIRALAKSKRR